LTCARTHDLIIACLITAVPDKVFAHSAIDEKRILRKVTDALFPGGEEIIIQSTSIDCYSSGLRFLQSCDKIDKGGFADARFAQDPCDLTGRNGLSEIFKELLPAGIAEFQVLESPFQQRHYVRYFMKCIIRELLISWY
jgi:hypothetical protein